MLNLETKENINIILNIVKNHFFLNDTSFSLFEERILNPEIDELYKRNLDENLRFKIKVPDELLEPVDRGWAILKLFDPFIKKFNITYKDFRNNIIEYDKSKFKLFKLMKKFYSENIRLFEYDYNDYRSISYSASSKQNEIKIMLGLLDKAIERIGQFKLPNKKLQLVLSLNFADWFLCSTSESWGSCLSLTSSCEEMYWTGLPGLIGDKNRAMIYLTDGTKKNYKGIVVDKMISRTWVLLDQKNKINYVQFYPNEYLTFRNLSKLFEYEFKKINSCFTSKYELDILFFKNGCSSFIYQDGTHFSKINKFIYGGNSGFYYFDKNNECVSNDILFSSNETLTSLIESSKSIEVCTFSGESCYSCGEDLTNDGSHTVDDDLYCCSCFNSLFSYCDSCETPFSFNELTTINDKYICVTCSDKFNQCSTCSESYLKTQLIIDDKNKDVFCKSCFKEYCKEDCACNFCDKEVDKDRKICKSCDYYNKFDTCINSCVIFTK